MKSGSRISRLRSETCYTVIRLSDIIGKVLSYHPNPRIELIEKAYVFSAKVHQGQIRLSGEPYLIHPLEVAAMLADLKLDDVSVTTGLLHDTVEDTYATPETIAENFGPKLPRWWTASPRSARCPYHARRSSRPRISARCSWPWPRTSGSS